MAVKASNSITLTSVIDVKATYRYYLLQSSTLTAPSKPTTFPPTDKVPQVVNLVSTATDDNGNIYNNCGYKDNVRWSASGAAETAAAGYRLTGWMPAIDGATYRLENLYTSGTFYFVVVNSDGTITSYNASVNGWTSYDSKTQIATVTVPSTVKGIKKFRVSGEAYADPPIITCDEDNTNSSTGTWDDTEPSYTDGSTNSLYFVDCTVFSDDTFSYSSVSLSSSYEAAKAAYNAAVSASNTAKLAMTTANGKNTVFYQASAPSTSGRKVNDVWFDTDDNNKMYYWSGSAWTAQQFGTNAIAANAITANLLAASAVTAGKIASGAVTTDKLYALSVTAEKIAGGAITTDKLAANAVTAGKIAANAVTASTIAAKSITTDKIAVGAVSADNIAANAITSDKIVSNAVTTDKLASNAVTANKILAGAITTDKLAANAVTAAKVDVTDLFAQDITATGTIRGLRIEGATGSFKGSVQATSGYIGQLHIQDGSIIGYAGCGRGTAQYKLMDGFVPGVQASEDLDFLQIYSDTGDIQEEYFAVDGLGHLYASSFQVNGEYGLSLCRVIVDDIPNIGHDPVSTLVMVNDTLQIGKGLYDQNTGCTELYGRSIELVSSRGLKLTAGDLISVAPGIVFKNNGKIYGTDSSGGQKECFNAQNGNNECVVGADNYTAGDGNTSVRGDDVLIYSAKAGNSNYTPYYRAGHTFRISIETAGYTTSGSKEIWFNMPFARPMIGSPTVTVSGTLRLRQNNNYTHGSTSSATVTPSSITASLGGSHWLRIKATMSATTNATNNAPIGIYAYLTITFS